MFHVGGVERFARDVAIGCRTYFGVEIAQPHINHEGRQTAAQRAVACEERNEKEEAQTWRHVEAALKELRGPSVS